MPINQVFVYGWGSTAAQVTVSADGEDNRSIALTDSSDVSIEWTIQSLQGFYLSSTGAFELILNPDSTSPESFNIAAGTPFSWNALSGMYYPFNTHGVEAIRLVSQQTAPQTVTLKTVQDTAS